MKNRVTEMLNILHPIALGGMAGVTDAPLVAAVSEAGGLGTLGAFKESGEGLARQTGGKALTGNRCRQRAPRGPQAPDMVSVVWWHGCIRRRHGGGNPQSTPGSSRCGEFA
jgi:hypothetical protein